MNHIIENIYLGDFNDAENNELLVKNNIKFIFNVAIECKPSQNILNMGVIIHKYNIYDDYDITLDILKNIYNKIEVLTSLDGNVLIHCAHGRSRSVCIVLYYLMRKYNYSLEESLNIVKKIRPIVHPSPNYIKLLSIVDNKFNINVFYINYLQEELKIDMSTNDLLDIVKNQNYDLNKIVNTIMNF